MSTFTIAEAEFQTWHQAVSARQELRGVAAIAKEMESHLQRASAGQVEVSRHTLFGWAEALDGAAHRDPRAASAGSQLSLQQVIADARAVLAGKERDATAAGAAGTATAAGGRAIAPPSPQPTALAPPPAPPSERAEPAPVTYTRSGGAAGGAGSGGAQFVPPASTGERVRALLREAQNEVLVISPWTFGVDTFADDLVALPPSVAVRALTRRPDRDEPSYHRRMEALTRRGAEVRFSLFLQTRMMIVDGRKLLLGAASVPPPGAPTREAAVVVEDRSAVQAAREHFAQVYEEAGR